MKDDVGGGLPNEGCRSLVPSCGVLINGFLQFLDATETAPADLLAGDLGQPAFHLVEPGTAGGGAVHVEPLPFFP